MGCLSNLLLLGSCENKPDMFSLPQVLGEEATFEGYLSQCDKRRRWARHTYRHSDIRSPGQHLPLLCSRRSVQCSQRPRQHYSEKERTGQKGIWQKFIAKIGTTCLGNDTAMSGSKQRTKHYYLIWWKYMSVWQVAGDVNMNLRAKMPSGHF